MHLFHISKSNFGVINFMLCFDIMRTTKLVKIIIHFNPKVILMYH